nr:hypothetical protein RchiOBHm_Chr7g0200261 [Ipomoea batatas]
MSKSIGVMSPSSFHWNEFSNDPTIIGTIRIANRNAGQILLPVPNGMSSKSCPLTSICKFQNLSGLKINGLSQILESRPIAHTLTRTCESLGIVYPHRITSCSTLRGINGLGGCIRRVSFMTHCKSSAIAHSNVLDELLVGVEFTVGKDGRNQDFAKGFPLRGDRKPNDRELVVVVSSESI